MNSSPPVVASLARFNAGLGIGERSVYLAYWQGKSIVISGRRPWGGKRLLAGLNRDEPTVLEREVLLTGVDPLLALTGGGGRTIDMIGPAPRRVADHLLRGHAN
jgi:hypothetical protein